MIANAKRFAFIALLAIALVQSSAAQTPDGPQPDVRSVDKFWSELHIDEITETPDRVAVRASRVGADGRIRPGLAIFCDGSSSGGSEALALQDLVLKTDDRWGNLRPGACDALLAAARRRRDAQGR